MNRSGQTVCLNMIVRNEAPVIARCLASVRPLIDSWVIVDTGSTDGTQEIVREFLADLPGELVERPWRDFGTNRTEALQLARGRADYVFVIDADEVVELNADFTLPRLTADAYLVTVALDGWTSPRRQLVRDALPWRYEGVLHESIVCEEARSEAELKAIRTIHHQDGSRSRDLSTPRRDALCLEEALIDDPYNSRYVFALAKSYRDAGDLGSALRHYRRRTEMPGEREETWYARYQIALVREALEHPWPEVLEAHLEAFELAPDRAEPLFRIGLHYQQHGRHTLAQTFLARAMEIPPPGPERLYVERRVYDSLHAQRRRRRPAVAVGEPSGTNGELPAAISCLMVTRDRLELAKRAIRCFGDQTHPERELIIVSEGEREYRTALERYIDEQAIERARVVRAEPGVPLGHLRNMTLDEAAGPIVCQWDDDDCSHPDRLAEQWEAMEREGADACFLIDHLQYLEQDRMIFWIDWTMSGALTDEWQLFPGTVMMRRDERFRYPEEGPYARHGEDSVMVDQLWHNVPVARVGGMGHLYLYHFHGKNTFSRDHHLHITTCAGTNERIEAMADKIREAVSYYPVPKPIPVLGASGPVFVVG